jgi:hypothetical protein
MYLASGWKRFCHVHQIRAGHFLVFNYDRHYTLTVTVFVETMCRHHYTPTALANAAMTPPLTTSSHGLLFVFVFLICIRIMYTTSLQ